MQEVDQRDRELLAALQGDIPLVSTPFAVLGQQMDMSEKEVIKRTEKLRREEVIRHIGGLFDLRAMGYGSCLVAARVDPERIDDAAAVINSHPCVTQNYRRNHDLNLWFTIAVAPTSRLGLERTIAKLADEAGCDLVRPLPTLRIYKNSNIEAAENHAHDERGTEQVSSLSAAEMEAVRLLQMDLPLQPRPFEALAKQAGGVSADEIISAAKGFRARGQMRRFGAVVQPRKSGFSATALTLWTAPLDRADDYGARMSKSRSVSHCYLRSAMSDWPYNLYTTVHARSVDECESIINDLAADTGLTDKQILYPTREYKQTRLLFFSPEAEAWEQNHLDAPAIAAS